MANDIIYTKTARGESALITELPDTTGQVLSIINGHLTEQEIFAKLDNVKKTVFREAMTWLLEGGFIKVIDSASLASSTSNITRASHIQVDEISLDEFDALADGVIHHQNDWEKAAEESIQAELRARKQKDRLETIETAKRITAAKAEEVARLNIETEAQKKAQVIAKKQQWAKIKTRADTKVAATNQKQEPAVEQHTKNSAADAWTQLKAAAKAKTEEDKRLAAIAKVEDGIKRQRLANKTWRESRVRQGFVSVFSGVKTLFKLFFVVLCITVIGAHYINIPMLANSIEARVLDKTQQKVNIQSAHIWLFPKPHLLLKSVGIADSSTTNAQSIRIYPDFKRLKNKLMALLTIPDTTPYIMRTIKIDGLSMSQSDLFHVANWQKAIANSPDYVIERLIIEDFNLSVPGLSLPSLQADIHLNNTNTMGLAKLYTTEQDIKLIITAVNTHYLVKIDAINWRAPLAPFPTFKKLQGSGTINNSMLTFPNLVGQLYNGRISADLQTNLVSPDLVTKGNFAIDKMVIDKMDKDLRFNSIINGFLSGKGTFSFAINQAGYLSNSPQLNATFNIKNGSLKTIDIAEAMRTQHISGTTSFVTLTGTASLNNSRLELNKLILQNKQLQAYGQATVSSDQQVSASVASTIAIQNNPISANLMIAGPINALRLIN